MSEKRDMRVKDTISLGDKFNNWMAIRKVGNNLYEFICDCGNKSIKYGSQMKHQKSTYCNRCKKHGTTTHGLSNTPLYNAWHSMKYKCENENAGSYHLFGGAGIKVCERWQDLKKFMEDVGERPPNMNICLIDLTKDFGPGNWKWATFKESMNQSQTRSPRMHSRFMPLPSVSVQAAEKNQSFTHPSEQPSVSEQVPSDVLAMHTLRADTPESYRQRLNELRNLKQQYIAEEEKWQRKRKNLEVLLDELDGLSKSFVAGFNKLLMFQK